VGCAGRTSKKALSNQERAELYINVAHGALLEGDPTTALHALRTAEELAPKMVEIYHTRAIAFESKKELELAIREADRAVELAPDSSAVLNTYGKLLIDAGRYREAIAPLTRAALDPYNRESFKAHTNLGILYYRRNEDSRSIEHFSKAIDGSPGQACHAHYYLGHVRLRQGKMSEAIRSYEKATQGLCARFVEAHYALGIAYERGRRFLDARKKFLSIRDIFPMSQYAEKSLERLRELP
jgi:type IV pilus assembly protein PilF